ncbi:simple sugar transport system permease protein [Desulfocicer vacuolatum DSM 3385]|uniref:Simple sugar transport system permease protein n=1 Tax=Desulfocicer vacuolatum DSM 3385 TaxID=1121400 RepID=A0A1W1ZSR8_9BACT|nr:ABC transporter permease [Desulfocicer vacuolatum]SMC51457.1 simple sugar transport system permease protein [Desulfocicer vacuolatum DSM 3385]
MLTIKISDRDRITPIQSLVTNVLSLLAALGAVGLIFLVCGVNPFFAISKIFMGSFGSMYGFKETVTKAIPLVLIGGGLTLAFRAKFWNIGAEGQLLMGAILGGWVGLAWGDTLPSVVIVPLMFAAGFLGGALCGLVPAFLKIKFAINEVISTLMINYICAEFLTLLIVGPWKGKTRFGFPGTDNLPDNAILGVISGSRIHYATLVLALISVVILTIVVYRSRFGYEVRVIGENPEAGRYAGINFFKTSMLIMLISGGLAGFAGVGEVAGIHHYLGYPASISSGYGFTAIIVAWLAKLNPFYAIVSGLFFAGILVGGDAIQMSLGLPAATVQIVNGTLLVFLIMGDFFMKNKVTIQRRASVES